MRTLQQKRERFNRNFWKKAREYYNTYMLPVRNELPNDIRDWIWEDLEAGEYEPEMVDPCYSGLARANALVNSGLLEVPNHVKGYFKRASKKNLEFDKAYGCVFVSKSDVDHYFKKWLNKFKGYKSDSED